MERYISYYNSKIGLLEIVANSDYLLKVNFCDKKESEEKPNSITKETKKQLDEYFNGERRVFSIKYLLNGTDFQKNVWNNLIKIKFAEVATYGHIAKLISNDKASRAVGGANNKNPIAIIIPCHRIIGSNKKLVGYAAGLDKKEWLLNHEKNNK